MSAGPPRALSAVPRAVLEELLRAVERGRASCPLNELELLELGLSAHGPALLEALGGLDAKGARAVLGAVVAERAHRPPPRLELVWSGPEAYGTVSRDTGLVLAQLFASARREVLLGGYAFDKPALLAPLHQAMAERGVSATLFLEITGHAPSAKLAEEHATRAIDRFFRDVWTFGAPRPAVYYDPRTATAGPPWVSLHAKCVVVDGARTLVTSANFTERGQERNIEVGVLLEDAALASELAGQWRALVSAGLLARYKG